MFKRGSIALFFCILVSAFAHLAAQTPIIKSAAEAKLKLTKRGEVIIRFVRPTSINFPELSAFLSIDKVVNDTVTAYANETGFAIFLKYGIPFDVVDPPSLQKAKALKITGDIQTDLSYPSYQEYLDRMEAFAEDYPQICTLEEFGRSVNKRSLLALKISDHPDADEKEPVVFYTSTMHGDETPGYIILLELISHILSGYSDNESIKAIVDNAVIWINPLANPDGTYFLSDLSPDGATRFNANHVDLNRDFPAVNGNVNQSHQQETLAMMNFMEQIKPDLCANIHSGAEVVNYPWDSWSRLHPDDDWYRYISRTFVDTVHNYTEVNYMTDLDNGITNGYDWYQVLGSRQDFTNYFLFSREVTLEISADKYPAESTLSLLWDYLHRSLLQYISHAFTGITGIVTDSITGRPLHAEIKLIDHDLESDHSYVFSGADDGTYFRLLLEGEYLMVVSSPGYVQKTILVPVSENELSAVDVSLTMIQQYTGGNDMYPNPFDDFLWFFIPGPDGELRVTFTDATGRMVYSTVQPVSGAGYQKITTPHLRNGLYVILFTYKGEQWRIKAICSNGNN